MLKNEYKLIQKDICKASGNFNIIEHLAQISQAQSLNGLGSPSQLNCGQFIEKKSCFLLNCFSCRTIKQLTLSMYGQIISKAHIDSCINLFPCIMSQQLIITTLNGILIGKVKKQKCCNSNILTIFDAQENIKYIITKKQCQIASILPRSLRCCKDIQYQIMNNKQQKIIGKIINKVQGCFNMCFTYLDIYDITMPKDSSDKDRILILNALVYLDIIKHQIL